MSLLINAPTLNFGPGSQYLFNRAYAISIQVPGQAAALRYSNFNLPGSSLPTSPIKLRFDIEKNSLGTPNKSKIDLFNLSEQSRQSFKVGYEVQLEVGYRGLTDILFRGIINPKGLKSDRSGPEIITTLECGDGESSINTTVLNKNYPPGSTLAQVLQDIAIAMNAVTAANPAGVTAGVALSIPNLVYGRGMTISGQCSDTLTKLLTPQGLRWSVQNGALNIIPVTGYNGDSAILVSSTTGMIGVPSRNDQYVEFKSLINPKLAPDALVQLQSENSSLNGYYKVLNAHYEGDSYDNNWNVSCQCTDMPNVTQAAVPAAGNDYPSSVSVA